MEEGARAPYNPYHDLRVDAGRKAFANLFNAEVHFVVPQGYANDPYAISVRRYAVRFIEYLTRSNDRDALIPYTAMTYFDRFLSRDKRLITEVENDDENFDLFVICCLTIAWKLRTKTFKLSKFLSEKVHNDRALAEYYSARQVREMELQICRRLEWRLRALTPFYFVEYFIPILNLQPDSGSPRRAVRQLIVKSQFDIAFTIYRPSVVAAAAVLTVTKHRFPNRRSEFVDNIITTSEFLNPLKDIILQCEQQLDHIYNWDTSIQIDEPAERPKPSEPIQVPQPPADTTIRHWPSETPAFVLQRQGKEPASASTSKIEEEPEELQPRIEPYETPELFRRRQGKEPAPASTSEIEEEPEEPKESDDDGGDILLYKGLMIQTGGDTRVLAQLDGLDADHELMDFDLGWIVAQVNADKTDGLPEPTGHVGFRAMLVQRLTDCCANLFMRGCNIL